MNKEKRIKSLEKELEDKNKRIEEFMFVVDTLFAEEIDDWRKKSKFKKGGFGKDSFWCKFKLDGKKDIYRREKGGKSAR